MDDNGKCTKGFPKFQCDIKKNICIDCTKHTIHGEETYPTYRRRCCKTLGNGDMKKTESKELEKLGITGGLGFTEVKCRYLGGADVPMDNR